MAEGYYKIKPEIRDFIIKEARERPELGCRKLANLIQEKFGLEVSKSSISAILKEQGLNKPVGRRPSGEKSISLEPQPQKKSSPYQGEAGRGLILEQKPLLTKIKREISLAPRIIQNDKFPPAIQEECRQVQIVLAEEKSPPGFIPNLGCWFLKASELCLGGVEPESLELFVQESLEQREVLGLKFILEDGGSFFLDGAMRSIWSKNHIPLEFSQGLSKVRDYLTSAIIQDNSSLIGQAAPGFAAPPLPFLNFTAAFSGKNSAQAIKKIEFYDDKDKLIEVLEPILLKRHYFVLGIWPWQYPDRSILEKEGLKLISHREGDREILTIVTNLSEEQASNEKVISLYLERWPNLEAGYQDFLDKIEHYFEVKKTSSSQKDNPVLPTPTMRMRLSSFCQRHFFPLKYSGADFSRLQECFFSLPGVVKTEEKTREIIFCRPQEVSHCEDLAYACQRVNEADVRLSDGRRLRFKILT